MAHTNASFSPSRTERLERQIDRLEHLSKDEGLNETSETLAAFDAETEQLLIDLCGPGDTRLEAYKYATLGEAEAMVNLPKSAQLAARVYDKLWHNDVGLSRSPFRVNLAGRCSSFQHF